MQVILLEKYKKLGALGDVVNVKNGFARNYLLPNKKAMQATEANKKVFEQKREALLKEFEAKRTAAEATRSKIEDCYLYINKQAGVDDRLYGSVTATDIIKAVETQTGETLNKNTIVLPYPIKYLGCHVMALNIFGDVSAKINVVAARTPEEAEAEISKAKAKANAPAAATVSLETIPEASLEAESVESSAEEQDTAEDE